MFGQFMNSLLPKFPCSMIKIYKKCLNKTNKNLRKNMILTTTDSMNITQVNSLLIEGNVYTAFKRMIREGEFFD